MSQHFILCKFKFSSIYSYCYYWACFKFPGWFLLNINFKLVIPEYSSFNQPIDFSVSQLIRYKLLITLYFITINSIDTSFILQHFYFVDTTGFINNWIYPSWREINISFSVNVLFNFIIQTKYKQNSHCCKWHSFQSSNK